MSGEHKSSLRKVQEESLFRHRLSPWSAISRSSLLEQSILSFFNVVVQTRHSVMFLQKEELPCQNKCSSPFSWRQTTIDLAAFSPIHEADDAIFLLFLIFVQPCHQHYFFEDSSLFVMSMVNCIPWHSNSYNVHYNTCIILFIRSKASHLSCFSNLNMSEHVDCAISLVSRSRYLTCLLLYSEVFQLCPWRLVFLEMISWL